MHARQTVEKAAAAVARADAEAERTREARDEAIRDAAASGQSKAAIARAASMSRPQVVGITQKGEGRARGGDVLARVANSAAAARAAREARHVEVLARDAVLAEVADAGELTAAEAARIANVTRSVVSDARARRRAEAEQSAG